MFQYCLYTYGNNFKAKNKNELSLSPSICIARNYKLTR